MGMKSKREIIKLDDTYSLLYYAHQWMLLKKKSKKDNVSNDEDNDGESLDTKIEISDSTRKQYKCIGYFPKIDHALKKYSTILLEDAANNGTINDLASVKTIIDSIQKMMTQIDESYMCKKHYGDEDRKKQEVNTDPTITITDVDEQ